MRHEELVIGSKYGKWTILGASPDKHGYYRCQCECGTIRDVNKMNLKSGVSTSCGCTRNKGGNIIGNKYGSLTVLEETNRKYSNSASGVKLFKCRCDCGSIVYKTKYALFHGKSTAHCRKCVKRGNNKKPMIGKRFGYLTVLERAEDKEYSCGQRFAMWKCLCDCGNIYICRGDNLRSGHVKSCGCKKKRRKKDNR